MLFINVLWPLFINLQVSENNNMTQYPMTARGAEMLVESTVGPTVGAKLVEDVWALQLPGISNIT